MTIIYNDYLVGARPTTIAWENMLQRIEDNYAKNRAVPHGVQKDAIQNGWDARKNAHGTDWKFTFRYVKGEADSFLLMQDEGTTGLTGRVLQPDEYLDDLPIEERWGRFESLAFTKDDTESALGSRGQGKFIFVVASEDQAIVYDTLRDDGTYRAGLRVVNKTDSPVNAWDGGEGQARFNEITGGLFGDLNTVGTRVVIINPRNDLVKALESGDFSRYIGETWWEIITKYNATIEIDVDGDIHVAKPPAEFKLPQTDDEHHRVWTVENKKIEGHYKVLKLHLIASESEPVPTDIRGVAIQRGGMKVVSLSPSYLPREITQQIYGYITVDDAVEKGLRRAEDPEHYGFNYSFREAKAVRNFIQSQCERFAQEKLGWHNSPGAIKARQQRNAERKALTKINEITDQLKFVLPTPGPGLGGLGGTGGSGGGGGGSRSPHPIRVRMLDFSLPRENDRRVNYEEIVEGASASVINETSKAVDGQLKFFLRMGNELIEMFVDETISASPDSETRTFGPGTVEFTEKEYPQPGKYTFVARFISLMAPNRGEVIHEERRTFYLEEEPPAKGGLFESCEPIDFPPEHARALGMISIGEEGGYTLQYNVGHPAYEAVAEDEDKLAEHLFRIMTLELCRVDFNQSKSVLFENTEFADIGDILYRVNEIFGEFAYDYYAEA